MPSNNPPRIRSNTLKLLKLVKHKKNAGFLAVLLGLITAAPPSHSASKFVYENNFDNNYPGYNRTPTGPYVGNEGTVDITGSCNSGSYFDLLPGNGCYVDLDGTSHFPGLLTSSVPLSAGQTYELVFDLAGSQRGDVNVVDISFGTSTLQRTVASSDPFTSLRLSFTPESSGFYEATFLNDGSNNIGAFLDNVVVLDNVVLDKVVVAEAPGPLPFFGAFVGFRMSRRLRNRVLRSQV